ncbi:hypothetical protein PTSG_02640 [Salpingoeca rosetta]|uniref:Uncharacterized protein n=1 Tax=Salpingoeca rosetta (strain ATCC 50818 / BSB-021) TaxID=946362 RepID=F2U2W1_SALR5|nr:uncharacterized protein PTSG_02640 [Salpingoeca rosetta]EGD81955.1 hypothetical protein PTSG_02640 [Salpingoeca rosetta]|eukprot:XP_004996138.1 hypothetical protein PTSG_02640 [Salpingoeca rosetta]
MLCSWGEGKREAAVGGLVCAICLSSSSCQQARAPAASHQLANQPRSSSRSLLRSDDPFIQPSKSIIMNFAKPEHSGGVASMPARRLKSGPNSPSHQIPTTAYSRSSKANASTNSVVFQSTDYSTGISAGATADGVRNNTASPVVVVTHKPIARVGEASRHVSPTELGPKANSSALYLQRNMRLESEPHARTTCAFERIQETEYSSAYDTSDDEQATYLEHMGAHFDDAVCTDRDSSPQTTDKNQRSQVEAPQRHMSQSKKKGIK